MPKEPPLKSAYELAMERLRNQDRDEGVAETKPLTAKQKAAIAKEREKAQAKLAELEILHRKDLQAAHADPVKVKEVEEHYQTDRRRVDSSLESAIERIRRQSD